MLLRCPQRRSFRLQRPIQAVAPHERGGANDELRSRLGLVLLDMGDGSGGAVELERRDAGRCIAGEGVGEGV